MLNGSPRIQLCPSSTSCPTAAGPRQGALRRGLRTCGDNLCVPAPHEHGIGLSIDPAAWLSRLSVTFCDLSGTWLTR
jgi:hypothetical protein